MKRSKQFKLRRVLVLMAMMFGAMVTMLQRPAYGQQDVDPTWYDPWAASNTAVVQTNEATQPKAAVSTHQKKVKSVSSSQRTAKVRGKQVTTETKPS